MKSMKSSGVRKLVNRSPPCSSNNEQQDASQKLARVLGRLLARVGYVSKLIVVMSKNCLR